MGHKEWELSDKVIIEVALGADSSPPTDSTYICYMNHDHCYGFIDSRYCGNNNELKKSCDFDLLNCLSRLSRNPINWPVPPKPGTENQSEAFRIDAKSNFTIRTSK